MVVSGLSGHVVLLLLALLTARSLHTNTMVRFHYEYFACSIDASEDDGTLGRLVNDDHISPNCEMKKVKCEGKPHLCLFAVKQISPGEEITFNYGDSSYPWRLKVCF